METRQETMEDAGHARYTHRLRVSATARAALEAEWGRCRWVWNECVANGPLVRLVRCPVDRRTAARYGSGDRHRLGCQHGKKAAQRLAKYQRQRRP